MSTTSTVDESARPSVGKYSKRLCNLSKQETQILVKHFHDDIDLTAANRSQLLTILFERKPEFKQDHQTRLVCFEVVEDREQHRLRFINCEHDVEYPERPCTSTPVNIGEILMQLQQSEQQAVKKLDIKPQNLENTLEKSGSDLDYHTPHHKATFKLQRPELKRPVEPKDVGQDAVNNQLVHTLLNITDRLQSSTQKRPFVSRHLQFDDSEDISVFFNKITCSAQGQGLTEDSQKINLATQVLSTSSTGSQLLGLCEPEDYKDWNKFCLKLLRMTGSSYKSYEQQFLGYERLPGQPSSLLMAKLIDLYKRSCQYSETQELNKFERRHIRMRFLLCLEPELRSLLEDRLSNVKEDITLEHVASKCQELETFYRLGSNKPKQVNAVNTKQESGMSDSQFEVLLEAIQNLQPSKVPRQTDKPRINDSKLQGYCMRFVKGTCPFDEKCKYKHTPVPDAVLKHMKQRYKVIPKSA